MASQRKLGIYWGSAGINLVEINKDVILASAIVPFIDLDSNPLVGVMDRSEDLRLLELFQKTLRSHSFSVGNAFLSLPSKDIIVRWFVLPWVKTDEIQGLVKFEAKKYIPFPLEELVFNYYPSTINKDGVKQIGIALTAIRKVHYERYTNLLIQAGVNVVFSEPSAMSLLRSLVFRKIISTDEVTAILTVREDSGEIAIVSQGYVKFIRDFSLRTTQPSPIDDGTEITKAKLFNEVRMSLDFFIRHNAGPEVKKVVAVAAGLNHSLFDLMGEDIALPVQVVDPQLILEKLSSLPDIGFVRAFGTGISGAVPAVIDFNLSEGEIKEDAKKTEVTKAFSIPSSVFWIAGVIFVLAGLLFLSIYWTGDQLQKKEAARKEVAERLGKYVDMTKEEIDVKVDLYLKKSAAIKSVPFKSAVTSLMIRIVQLLPKGVWFEDVKVVFKDESPLVVVPQGKKKLSAEDYYVVKTSSSMILYGVASLNNTNAEFELINQFVETLSTDPELKKRFTTIKINEIKEKESGLNQNVTAFSIEFK